MNSHPENGRLRITHPLGRLKAKAGFSISELMVAVGVGIIMMAGVSTIYVLGQQSWNAVVAYTEIHNDAKLAVDWITRDLRSAKQLVNTITIGINTFATGNSQLIMGVPSIDGDGNVIDDTSDFVVYHLNTDDATILERTIDADVASSRADGTRVVARNINTVAFSSGGTGLSSVGAISDVSNVELALATRKNIIGNRNVNDSFKTVVELRNKE